VKAADTAPVVLVVSADDRDLAAARERVAAIAAGNGAAQAVAVLLDSIDRRLAALDLRLAAVELRLAELEARLAPPPPRRKR